MKTDGAVSVRLDHILAAIKEEIYQRIDGTNVTTCILRLKNGFDVMGQSACVSDELFDEQKGKDLAREDAIDRCWPLFGFHLATIMSGWTMDS